MPVWHASVSLWTPDGVKVRSPGVAEREAVKVLAGVGGDREWWFWNPAAQVGHLRVALTVGEFARVPPGVVIADAGESGPQRKRTVPRLTRVSRSTAGEHR